jgi:hypothetical protein
MILCGGAGDPGRTVDAAAWSEFDSCAGDWTLVWIATGTVSALRDDRLPAVQLGAEEE